MKYRTTATIPLDIIESVIEAIAIDEDTRSLKAISQTCHTLLTLCRKHIFSTIQLSHKSDNSRHFNDLLSTSPDIARYVKHLEYFLDNPTDDDQKVLDVLQKHSDLRSVHLWSQLWSQRGTDWSAFPASIRSSLLSLIQLPTITHLRIRCFTKFPATALLHCHNLIDLQMEWLEITSPEAKHVSIRDKIPTPISLNAETGCYSALEALLQTAGPEQGPIVDFRLLQSASFEVEFTREILIVQEVIKTTTQLQSLFIFNNCPLTLAGLVASLANSCWTLKSATFDILVSGDDFDPLCGLSNELRMLSRNSVLEEFKLIVNIQTDAPCRTRSDDWSDLDAVLTGPGFSLLRRVSVEVEWWSFSRNEAAVENVLNSLTAERFARLSESITVAFEFSAQNEYVAGSRWRYSSEPER